MSGYLLVRVGSTRYGVRLADVVEVAATAGFSPVPAVHRAIRGVVEVRRRLVPLVNLPALLSDVEPAAQPSDTCVLATCAGRPVALEVDEIDALVREEPEKVPPGWRLPWAAAVARHDAQLIPVLDSEVLASRLAGAQ